MPPVTGVSRHGAIGAGGMNDFHRENMIERLHEVIRQALGVPLKFPDGYKPNVKTDGSSVKKYSGSPKFGELEDWLSALVYRYALMKFGGPDPDTDRVRVYSMVEYLEGDAAKWFTRHVLSPKRAVNFWTFSDVVTGLYDRFIHPSSMQDAREES